MKFRFLTLSIILIAGALTVKAQQTNKTVMAEEVVAIVGNSPVMLSDVQRTTFAVIENRKKAGVSNNLTPQEEAIETLLLQKLLAQHAQADSLDKELNVDAIADNVKQTLDQMIEDAGSVKALEKRYGKAIFQISKDIENQMTEQEMAESMHRKIQGKTKVSNYDVEQFFRKIPQDSLPLVAAQYVYAQILKMPPQTEERKYKVREQLLEFRKRVINGEKLSVLARLYSQDPGSASNMGEYPAQPIQSLVGPFASALETLKPGQISEIVETQYGFHIIELISKKGDIVQYRHLLLKPEFTAEETEQVTKELDSLANELRKETLTFANAAKKYSNDAESKNNGGLVYNKRAYLSTRDIANATTRFIPDEIDVDDNRRLSKMKVNDISDPFETLDIDGNKVYKIVSLRQIIPAHTASIDQDFEILSRYAMMDKQAREVDQWINDAIGKMYIYIAPEYRNINFDHKQWLETCIAKEQDENTVAKRIPKNLFENINSDAPIEYQNVEGEQAPPSDIPVRE